MRRAKDEETPLFLRPTLRPIALLASLLMLTSLGVGTGVTAARADVAMATCGPDSNDERLIRATLCINHTKTRVRGYLAACIRTVDIKTHLPGSRFSRNTCSGGKTVQAERIAQTRFIQDIEFNAQLRAPLPGKTPADALRGRPDVHPGVQWEINSALLPAKRADVLSYDPDYTNAGNPADKYMSLWELKTSVNYSSSAKAAADAQQQAEAYRSVFQYERSPNDASSRSLWDSMVLGGNDSIGYRDWFVIEVNRCDEPFATTSRDDIYNVTDAPDYPGAIIAARTIQWHSCQNGKPTDEVVRTEEPYHAERWFGLVGEDDPYRLVPVSCSPLQVCVPLDEPANTPMIYQAFLSASDNNTAIWRQRSAAFCAAIATLEVARGSAGTPIATVCHTSDSFPDLLDDAGLMALLQTLDDQTLRAIFSLILIWMDPLGTGNVTPAIVRGDPHLVTLDGLNYDIQSVGEFNLLGVEDREVGVQARFAAAGTQSSLVAIATEWGGVPVELHADGTLLVNGEPKTLAPGEGIGLGDDEVDGGYLVNEDGTYRISWDAEVDGEKPVSLSWQPTSTGVARLGVEVPAGVATVGLLGDNDGDPMNDLRLRTGEPVDASNAVQIHDSYADSWRVLDEASMFTYAAGQSTATFTDRSFPKEIVTLGDFSAAEQADAQQVCEATNVVAGPAFRDCMLDVLVTRDNDFAKAFIGTQDPVRSIDDRVMTEGEVTEDFEAPSVAPNFAPIRTSTTINSGRVAGPFSDTDQYRLYVPGLPGHDQLTVSFDAVAVGDWDAADAVAARVDGQPAQTLDLTGATIGATSAGTATRTKRITIPIDHHAQLVTLAMAGSGLTGQQAFAIDNVKLTAHRVAAQSFTPTLAVGTPTALRQPTLGTGSGELENWGAEDRYTLALSNQDLLLDWQTLSSTVQWTLAKANGDVVAAGSSAEGDRRLRDLDGTYRLSVEGAGDAPPQREVYSLDVLATPPAQQFSFELPGPVNLPKDLPSPAEADGAGSLETPLSVDVYSFTVAQNDRTVTVNPTTCPTQSWRRDLSWSITTQAGAPVASGNCWSDSVTGLAAGDYKLRVEPNRQVTGRYQIVVTQDGPSASFSPAPPNATKQNSPTFTFDGDATTAAFECALDAPSYTGPFTACASPKTYNDLPDGAHTVRIRAKDADGNLGPAVKHTFTVDTVAPNVEITRKPPAVSNINGPVLQYSGDKQGMSYQCSLVPVGAAADYAPCSGSSVYRNLTHGTYRFTVLGSDYVGNESTASYDFMVDLEPPAVTLTPASDLTSTNSPQFTFTADEPVTYECSLVPTNQTDSYSACTSPKRYTGIADGTQYRFIVKATDRAGQWASRGVTWIPYATPPTVTLTSKPPASSSNGSPSFAFTSSMNSPAFTCSLELATAPAAFSPCTSPKTYSSKPAGTYKFTIKATDAAGSWVSSSYQFTVTASDTQAPTVPGTPTVSIAPAGSMIGGDTSTPAQGIQLKIDWTASTDNVGVTGYQLWSSKDGAAYVNAGTVTGTTTTLTVPPGTSSWRFQVKASDGAGNTSTASTASTAAVIGLEQETASTKLTYAGTWTNASQTASSGGATRYATATTATATYKPATGTTQVAVVMASGPAAGKATITVDGGSAVTIDLYAATDSPRQIVLSTAALSATSAHTIVVKPAGTKNTASSSTRIDLDGFITRK